MRRYASVEVGVDEVAKICRAFDVRTKDVALAAMSEARPPQRGVARWLRRYPIRFSGCRLRAVAERITELVDKTGAEVVFVCGEVRSRTDVVSALPERVADRVSQLPAGAHRRRVNEHELADEIDAEFERRRRAQIAQIAERFDSEAARGSGLAAEGLAAVCAALRAGVVERAKEHVSRRGERLGDALRDQHDWYVHPQSGLL